MSRPSARWSRRLRLLSMLALLSGVLIASACSTNSKSVPAPLDGTPTSTYRPYPVAEEAREGGGLPAASAPAEAQGVLRGDGDLARREKAADDRPGLGTVYGEGRYAPVQETPFERADSSPTFVAKLHYNDAAGIEAQRSRLIRARDGEPLFESLRRHRPWGGVMIRVIDGGGRSLPAYHTDGRVLLVGEAGQSYAIEVENRTGQRFEILASVDGLDVIDGQPASFEKRGYLVAPYGRLRIEGFRKSMTEVATFRFGSVRDSYAAQVAEFGARHVGVIGVALFSERGAALIDYDLEREAERREAADPFPGRFAPPPPRSVE